MDSYKCENPTNNDRHQLFEQGGMQEREEIYFKIFVILLEIPEKKLRPLKL